MAKTGTTTTATTAATFDCCAENENYVAMWRGHDSNDNSNNSGSFDEYASLEVFAFHQRYDDQFIHHRETTTTTTASTRRSTAAASSSTADKVMADSRRTTTLQVEERQDREHNHVSPACSADDQRKGINLFVFASTGSTLRALPPPPPPTTTTTTTGEEPFLEMEQSPSDIASISENDNIILMDDDPHEQDMLLHERNETVVGDASSTTRRRASAPPPVFLPVSRCSSLSVPRRKSSSASSASTSLISPIARSPSTRSVVVVRTISLASCKDVDIVLEEPTDIRRVSFASREATYVESDLPFLTEDDIARYFWGDRECLESRKQRRQLVNTFKRHMRDHPEPQWTEEVDSVRGLEDHLEELMGRPSSHLLRRRHEREILTEYYRMKSEGKMCSERLGAVSRQSSYEECQRAARAAAEDAIVAANDQNTYSILYRPETTTTGTTSSAVHKRSRSMSPTTSTKTAEKHVSFMDSLQGMVSCGVGYE